VQPQSTARGSQLRQAKSQILKPRAQSASHARFRRSCVHLRYMHAHHHAQRDTTRTAWFIIGFGQVSLDGMVRSRHAYVARQGRTHALVQQVYFPAEVLHKIDMHAVVQAPKASPGLCDQTLSVAVVACFPAWREFDARCQLPPPEHLQAPPACFRTPPGRRRTAVRLMYCLQPYPRDASLTTFCPPCCAGFSFTECTAGPPHPGHLGGRPANCHPLLSSWPPQPPMQRHI
jgi:hypothetical protein